MPRTVAEAMTHEVLTVRPETPFKQLAGMLVEHRIDGMPVVDDSGRVLGVVTGSDLTCHEEQAAKLIEAVRRSRTTREHARKARGRTARDLMTAPARTISPQAGVREALALMGRAKVGRLVVTQGDRVVGMLTRSDMLRIFTRSDEELQDEVERRVGEALGDDAGDVRTSVQDGVVRLQGEVERARTACAAASAAAGVAGVVAVEDALHARVDDLAELVGVPGA